jgi:hypothetical protein
MSFMTWKNPGHLAFQTEFFGTPTQISLNPTKLALFRQNREEWDN